MSFKKIKSADVYRYKPGSPAVPPEGITLKFVFEIQKMETRRSIRFSAFISGYFHLDHVNDFEPGTDGMTT